VANCSISCDSFHALLHAINARRGFDLKNQSKQKNSTYKVELPVLSSCLCHHLPEHDFVKEKVINSSPAFVHNPPAPAFDSY
jgi:hypothetical protein